MTPAEIVAAFLDREITYGEAYGRLAFAGVPDPGRVLIRPQPTHQEQGWAAVFARVEANPWTT